MTLQDLLSRTTGAAALAVALAFVPGPAPVRAQGPVVDAVLFYSPTCPHCHEVINRVLPPLRERYGERFVIVGVDVTTPRGSSLYEEAVEYYGLAPDRLGVPLMVIGDVTLLGSQEISDRFPGLIEEGLASGGTDWPSLPALREALTAQGAIPRTPAPGAEAPTAATEAPDTARGAGAASVDAPATPASEAPPSTHDTASPPRAPGSGSPGVAATAAEASPFTTSLTPAETTSSLTVRQRFLQDPAGNGFAVGVLVVLLAALTVGVLALRPGAPPFLSLPGWVVPALATLGLAVALYLSLVDLTGTQAVCGPVGDCHTVQQSDYAHLFGVPVGLLGALGYLGILAAWSVATLGPAEGRPRAWRAVWIITLLGTAFSAYLTFLEPFVIGATCVWCLTSALIMSALLVSATDEVRHTA